MSLRDVDETRQPSLTLYLPSHHKARVCLPSRYLCFSSAFLGALPLYFESETFFLKNVFNFHGLSDLPMCAMAPDMKQCLVGKSGCDARVLSAPFSLIHQWSSIPTSAHGLGNPVLESQDATHEFSPLPILSASSRLQDGIPKSARAGGYGGSLMNAKSN